MDSIVFSDTRKRGLRRKQTCLEFLSFICILLFAYAGFSKLMEYKAFVEQLKNSPFIANFSKILSYGIPTVEFVAIALLCFPATRTCGFMTFTGIMVAFTSYIAIMLRFSASIPCICGGIISSLSWSQHMIFNTVFIFIGLAGIILSKLTTLSKRS